MSPWARANPEVAVPLMTPVIVSWPELESVRLAVGPRLILPAMSMVPVPARVTPPLPWQTRLPVMVVVPEPEIDRVPLLALVMVPLITSSVRRVAEVDDGFAAAGIGSDGDWNRVGNDI